MNKKEEEFITQEHLDYLDTLRESGVTNMYGSTSYIMEEFDIPKNEASKILSYWMKTFSDRMKENNKKTKKEKSMKEQKPAKTKKESTKGVKVLTILKMVEAGKTRKQIIDKLVSINEEISRKSNAGLVSHILTKNSLTIDSGVDRTKKKTITAATV